MVAWAQWRANLFRAEVISQKKKKTLFPPKCQEGLKRSICFPNRKMIIWLLRKGLRFPSITQVQFLKSVLTTMWPYPVQCVPGTLDLVLWLSWRVAMTLQEQTQKIKRTDKIRPNASGTYCVGSSKSMTMSQMTKTTCGAMSFSEWFAHLLPGAQTARKTESWVQTVF